MENALNTRLLFRALVGALRRDIYLVLATRRRFAPTRSNVWSS
ncbi:MAG TPA: hypothetical protein VJB97_03375 [Candidatus Paceibacterota bacterium]